MHKMTKATQIPLKVKESVSQRDDGMCVICGAPGDPVCHVVRRSQGGLGIEQNIVTLCAGCHREFDEGKARERYYCRIVSHLKGFYPDWSRERVIYRKERTWKNC